jgi:thiol reductant ABC exporter CydD subunit/thiol reductant ABC exporter CydC subunit
MTSLPGHAPLSAKVSTVDPARPGRGPLGALPALSGAARRALALAAGLAVLNATALAAQAFLLASVLASIVAGQVTGGRTAQLVALLGVVAGRALIGWAVRMVAARAAAGAKAELRAKAVDHALRLGPEWISARGTGELTALTTRGLDALDAYFTEYLPALVTAAVVPLGVGAAVLFADWPSAVIIALTVPLLPVFAILVGRHTADRVSTATDAVHRLSGHLLELVRVLPVLAAFRRAEAQAEAVRRISDRHRRATVATLRVAFSSAFVLELVATLSVALVAVVIGVRLVSGELPLAIGLGVLILAPECYQPLRAVGAAFHASEDGVEAVRRVSAVLAEPVPGQGTERPGRGEIAVRDLRVARRGGFAPDGESFVARPGSTVWLRSPSGAGKSTTLAALLGFAEPAAGSVTIGGVPLSDVDLSTWRREVAWVPQSPAFTGGTVRAELELAVADRDQELRPGELSRILEDLSLTGLSAEPVTRLSLGQRQRVAVARALLRIRHGAWVLLLDEPTAHLDAPNAARVLDAIRDAEHGGAAVIIAAHDRAEADDPADHAAPPAPVTSEDEAPAGSKPLALREFLDRRLLGGAALGAGALLAGIALTATSGWLIAKASQQPPILTLSVAVVGVRAFGLGRAGLRYAERLVTHDAAFRIATRLRVALWQALVRLGPARTLALRQGEGQRRLVGDVDAVRDLLPRVLTPPVVAAAVLVGAVVVQIALLPAAGLVLGFAVLIAACGAPSLALRAERSATSKLSADRREIGARILGLFESAAELLAFGACPARRAELSTVDERLTANARRQALGAGSADGLIILLTGFAMVASTWFALGAVAAGNLDPVLAPILALVPLATAEALALLPPAAQHWDTLRTSRTHLTKVPQCGFRGVQRPESHIGELECPESHIGGVQLSGVDLRWPGSGGAVLKGVDVRVPEGSWVAVTGVSGAGKSTLLAALLGFLPPERGTARLPRRIAWAPQEPMLVATTVEENLRLADPHATDDRLAEALRLACLPELDPATRLGSGGSGLSGGQAQRLAVARALVAAPDADLILLDEPTAHLDPERARELRENLRTALAGRTVVQVTHHAEEAEDADFVLDVRDGGVITHVTARTAVTSGSGL